MAFTSKMFNGIHRALMRVSIERHPPFRIISHVREQAFMRVGPKKIECVLEEPVVRMAHLLEATLVMGEMVEGNQPVALEVTYTELSNFVAYVRQLDDMYRKQADKIIRLERENVEMRRNAGVSTP